MSVLLRRFDRASAATAHESLLDIHEDCYAAAPGCSFDPRERFSWLLDAWSCRPAWACVIAYEGDTAVGCAHGAPLTDATSWWSYVVTPLPAGFTQESGTRTFAVTDLMVRPQWRKTGTAARIHQELLAGRPEERATLLVDSTQPKVQSLYETWGYAPVGHTGPFDHAEALTVMVQTLRTA
ncbi:GNAT family N-acetyltransferase [Streptomyces klenkii]